MAGSGLHYSVVMQLLGSIAAWFAPKSISGIPHVIDGDTLAVGGTRIRIWGIDAPEMDTWQGKQARGFLINKLAGRNVTCVKTGQRSYGRIVAKVYADGEDIAWWLVNAGHAVDWPQFSGGYYRSGTSYKLRSFIIAYRRRQRAMRAINPEHSLGWKKR